ncbi:lysoplasmalogenase [Nocardioides guangzhouensis]|uniref:Lysoplasmalogenase n=1 Tax=Nocardioides guangzhouensis TaxID=2497878 RepID=A0A4Q4ZCN7_9ACTN|nr:lysoplasmalogenase [Nocardioides guangzhouensis]RYP85820.1 lysoplasmalogenase [Nocardioides guangzhouensis]
MTARVLLAAYAVASVLNIAGQLVDGTALDTATKPLLMPLLLGVLLASARLGTRLLRATAAALVFSWLGDLFLMPGGDTWFLLGLAAFLGAQVCYCIGFATRFSDSPLRRRRALVAPYVAWWLLLLVVLGPDLGGMVVPVAVYGAVLCTMAALATGVHRWTTIGALLFVASDSVLAATSLSDRLSVPADGAVVMTTYTLGQALIVLGVLAASGAGLGAGRAGVSSPGARTPPSTAGAA